MRNQFRFPETDHFIIAKPKPSFTETAKPSHEQVSIGFRKEPSKTNYFIKRQTWRQVRDFCLLLSILL